MPVRYGDKFTVPSSDEFWNKSSVRKKIGNIQADRAKSPPKSKVKSQSSKPIPRHAGRISYEGYAGN